jgi:hypothetical protein
MNQDTKRRRLKKVSTKSAQPKTVDEFRAWYAPPLEPLLTDDNPDVRAFAEALSENLLAAFAEGGMEAVTKLICELRETLRANHTERFRQEMRDLVAPRLTGHSPQVCEYMYKLIDAMTEVYANGGINAVDNGMQWLDDAIRRDREAQEGSR